MKLGNLTVVAFRSIMKNRMRSVLTMLGIIIGVGSVIIMVSIGRGTQVDIESRITSMGTNLLTIFPGSGQFRGVQAGAGSLTTLTMGDVDKIKRNSAMVKSISPVIRTSGQVIAEGANWQTRIYGVSPDYIEIRNLALKEGNFFTEHDVRGKAKVAVVGKTVAEKLFNSQSPIGKKIRVGNVPFAIIGLLEEKGQGPMGDEDDIILAPSSTVLYRMSDGKTVHSIIVSTTSMEIMDEAAEEIRSILRTSHHLADTERDDFTIRKQTDMIETASSITGFLTMLLGAIAGVSLVVGGIGIMNIMLVSVTERTREIGIRLAVGARPVDVLVQFLIEALILSLIGGMVGVVAGILIAKLTGIITGLTIVIDPVIIFVSFLFSGGVGVFFGFYPARKASRLNPIDALRYE
ncbi:MAG: ABC transporter permease [Spirochaetota bacterium]